MFKEIGEEFLLLSLLVLDRFHRFVVFRHFLSEFHANSNCSSSLSLSLIVHLCSFTHVREMVR